MVMATEILDERTLSPTVGHVTLPGVITEDDIRQRQLESESEKPTRQKNVLLSCYFLTALYIEQP